MVILPRGRFSGEVRQRIQDALVERFQGEVLNYFLAMSAGDQARLHFYLSARPETLRAVSPEEIEQQIRQLIRSWEDALLDEMIAKLGEAEAQRLLTLYSPAFNDEYRAANAPDEAVHDLVEMEKLPPFVELPEAQLAQLKAQLRAHFFFNSLNTISALMHVDAPRADRLLTRLADLLRATLQWSDKEITSLREEIRMLELYAQNMQ